MWAKCGQHVSTLPHTTNVFIITNVFTHIQCTEIDVSTEQQLLQFLAIAFGTEQPWDTIADTGQPPEPWIVPFDNGLEESALQIFGTDPALYVPIEKNK